MRRREFLKKGTLVAGLAGSSELLSPLKAGADDSKDQSANPVTSSSHAPRELCSADFLRRQRAEEFLPKPAVFRQLKGAGDVPILPMPLAERLRRNIVPRQGFLSTAPGRTTCEGVTSGNGRMYVEVVCDPYAEQILFHHESLLMPWKRPFEAPEGTLAATPNTGAADCELRLPEGRPVEIQLKLGMHKPIEWVAQVRAT